MFGFTVNPQSIAFEVVTPGADTVTRLALAPDAIALVPIDAVPDATRTLGATTASASQTPIESFQIHLGLTSGYSCPLVGDVGQS